MLKDPTKLIITIGFGCLLILMTIIAFISLTQMSETIDDMSAVVKVTNAKMYAANTMRDNIRLRGETIQNMYLTDDFFEREKYRLHMSIYALEFKKAYDQFRKYGMNNAEREITKRMTEHAATAEAINTEVTELLLTDVDNLTLTRIIIEANTARTIMLSMLNELVLLQEKNAKAALINSVTYHQQTQTIVIFLSAIAVMIGILISIMVVREATRKTVDIRYQASHDALTNLINRKEFEHRLDRAIESIKDQDESHIVCFLDLDQFKVINDTCGHDAGDELLRQITAVIAGSVRDRDTLGRLGGDEFGLLFERCSLEKAIEIAEGIISLVKSYDFNWDERTFRVGVSIGIVKLTPDTTDAATAMNQADVACYAAKDMGRNCVHVYEIDDSKTSDHHKELGWISNIKDSIQQDRFRLYVQPIVPISSSAPLPMYEVLLRVINDAGEIVSPGKYIPAAERFNLMREVDEWVLEKVINIISEKENYPGMCINLSNNSLADKEFFFFVENLLQQHSIQQGQLCIEITEKTAIKNIQQTVKFIEALKRLNCQFALDDFGSGISSFGYLKDLPVDYLKIDGGIVSNMAQGNIDHAMVAAINQIGKVMGIKTIAEHVENESTLIQLKTIGVDFAQGYTISRPFPIEELDLQSIIQDRKFTTG